LHETANHIPPRIQKVRGYTRHARVSATLFTYALHVRDLTKRALAYWVSKRIAKVVCTAGKKRTHLMLKVKSLTRFLGIITRTPTLHFSYPRKCRFPRLATTVLNDCGLRRQLCRR